MHVSKAIEHFLRCGIDADSRIYVGKNIQECLGLPVHEIRAWPVWGPAGRSTLRLPAAFQRPDFAAIYEDQVAAEEVLPGASSVESDASGSHGEMMPTIAAENLISNETVVGLCGATAADPVPLLLRGTTCSDASPLR